MTKKDIKAGDIVLLKDGRTCMVMPSNLDKDSLMLYGKRFMPDNCSFVVSAISSLGDYTDDLQDCNGFCNYDIEAVRRRSNFFISDPKVVFNMLYSKYDHKRIYWDWKREEIKEVTMAEVEEKFGCKVKIVKEEN